MCTEVPAKPTPCIAHFSVSRLEKLKDFDAVRSVSRERKSKPPCHTVQYGPQGADWGASNVLYDTL